MAAASMNDIALTLRRRAMRGPVAEDPDLLHGLLMLRELGNRPAGLAKAMGVAPEIVAELMRLGGSGRAQRVKPYMGDKVHDRPADLLPAAGSARYVLVNLFPQAWNRRLIGLLMRPGGAPSRDLRAALEAESYGAGLTTALAVLRRKLNRLGVAVLTDDHRGRAQATYWIPLAQQLTLERVIDNDWKARLK